MAWGLAEFDAEQRGKKEGYSVGLSDGISQGSQQAKIETAKNMLTFGDSIEKIADVAFMNCISLSKIIFPKKLVYYHIILFIFICYKTIKLVT